MTSPQSPAGKESRSAQAARASWICIIVIIVFNFMMTTLINQPSLEPGWGLKLRFLSGGFSILMALIGLACGIAGLVGLRRNRITGMDHHAIIGIALNTLLLILYVAAIFIGIALRAATHR
jgi:hypothetical protein